MAASADRLDDFLADARARGRPAVSISPGLAAELLGFAPDATYWAARQLDGWVVDVGAVITFSPVVADDDVELTDVRVVIDWLRPDEAGDGPGIYRSTAAATVRFGETDDIATVSGTDVRVAKVAVIGTRGDEMPRSLDDPRRRRLALLAAEIQQDQGGGRAGGGSGI